jgi:hypothetical protein
MPRKETAHCLFPRRLKPGRKWTRCCHRSGVFSENMRWKKSGPSTEGTCQSTKRALLAVWASYRTEDKHVGFEVLTAVVMKNTIFWNIMACSPLSVNWYFGGTYRFHLQGRKISRARNHLESRWQSELCSRPCGHCDWYCVVLYTLNDCTNSTLQYTKCCGWNYNNYFLLQVLSNELNNLFLLYLVNVTQ